MGKILIFFRRVFSYKSKGKLMQRPASRLFRFLLIMLLHGLVLMLCLRWQTVVRIPTQREVASRLNVQLLTLQKTEPASKPITNTALPPKTAKNSRQFTPTSSPTPVSDSPASNQTIITADTTSTAITSITAPAAEPDVFSKTDNQQAKAETANALSLQRDVRQIIKQLDKEHPVLNQFPAKVEKDSWQAFQKNVAAAGPAGQTTYKTFDLPDGARITKVSNGKYSYGRFENGNLVEALFLEERS
ncbi:MAG: hypothetical protein K2X63_02295, partial [Burkholderiaceae bacterium]|nr:hypothetical protein [Burkholderiaceae bacterium]